MRIIDPYVSSFLNIKVPAARQGLFEHFLSADEPAQDNLLKPV